LRVQQTYLDEGILKLPALHFDTIFELGEGLKNWSREVRMQQRTYTTGW